MTKMGSFVFFGLPPEGSGVTPKFRIWRYFLSESGMITSRGLRVASCGAWFRRLRAGERTTEAQRGTEVHREKKGESSQDNPFFSVLLCVPLCLCGSLNSTLLRTLEASRKLDELESLSLLCV